ncbi:hypothetical protein [Nonomuraea sp. NPDC003214]
MLWAVPEVINLEALVKKMTIRRKSDLRLLAGARRIWFEWCW